MKVVNRMDDLISKLSEIRSEYNCFDEDEEPYYLALSEAIKILSQCATDGDTVSRQAAIDAIDCVDWYHQNKNGEMVHGANSKEHQAWYKSQDIYTAIEQLPSVQPDESKYEYHYDHTDCIWYRPEARNRCPTTCAQYRDGWNDAMQYIFRNGKGYRPYRRDKKYE